MNKRTCGKCSECGCKVTIPEYWMSVVDPEPTCEGCGAVADTLPIIKMTPKAKFALTSEKSFDICTKLWQDV